MRAYFVSLLLGLLLVAPVRAGIRDTVHNLSVSGPGAVRAEEETRICIFCHTPHHASPTQGVLWNRADSTVTYIPYESATLRATVGQPTGSSKLCLSCHDGTVALGQLLSEPTEVGFVGGVRFIPPGSTNLGADLSDDHPVSFEYDSTLMAKNPELADPESLVGRVRLDPFGQLQCTSCHDPHDEGFGKFLVASTLRSDLCLTCHDPAGWPSSSHANSTAIWNGSPPDPWPHTEHSTVETNACANCHRSHGATSSAWLLNRAVEEDNCLACHNGQVAGTNIELDITLPFHHPVELTSDVHTPNEDPSLPLVEHAECTDCHNPHATADTAAAAPLAGGPLEGATGVGSNGLPVLSVSYEYEVCFKCHGQFSMSDPPVIRQILEHDKVLQFDQANPSYHPVEAPGRNPAVPSLLPPLNAASVIYCSDCHASQSAPGAGGTGPRGPHGSTHPFILERQYSIIDPAQYDFTLYDLCYKCHSETSILADESFKQHKKHVEGADTPCSVCHDPHGISDTQGNPTNNSHLINFDITVVSPDPDTGRLEFEDLGTFRGQCYLECHGQPHSPKAYNP